MSLWCRRAMLSGCFLLGVAASVGADGLAVPVKGAIQVVDLATVRAGKSVSLKGDGIPVLAIHPQSTVLASVSPTSGLIFWNLPSFTEASQTQDPLFQSVVEMKFSPLGDRIYLLSSDLKAVLVYSLATSSVESIYPVPGGEPLRLMVGENALLIEQRDGGALLDMATGDLLTQWRFGSGTGGAMFSEGLPALSVPITGGVWSFESSTASPKARLSGDGSYGALLPGLLKGSFFAYRDDTGALEAWSGPKAMKWSAPLTAGEHDLVLSPDGQWVYALNRGTKMLTVLEGASGRELGKLPVPDVAGRPVFFQEP